MKINIELYELKNICMQMAELGAAANERAHIPLSDKIKQRQVYEWFKAIGERPSLLNKMEESGLVKGKRKGAGKNSPIYYSRLEIQSALNAIKMDKYINK